MPAAEKLSISLDTEHAKYARRKAEEKGLSLSAYLAECIDQQMRSDSLDRLLETLGADDIPEDEQAGYDRELDEALRKAKRAQRTRKTKSSPRRAAR